MTTEEITTEEIQVIIKVIQDLSIAAQDNLTHELDKLSNTNEFAVKARGVNALSKLNTLADITFTRLDEIQQSLEVCKRIVAERRKH